MHGRLQSLLPARMPVSEWERTFTCPYNPAHQITVEKIQVRASIGTMVTPRPTVPPGEVPEEPPRQRAGDLSLQHLAPPAQVLHPAPRPPVQGRDAVPPLGLLGPADGGAGAVRGGAPGRHRQHLRPGAPAPAQVPARPAKCSIPCYSTEDWEEEATVRRSYDPSARCGGDYTALSIIELHRTRAASMPVLRKLEGATPSQRREFRAQVPPPPHLHLHLHSSRRRGSGGRRCPRTAAASWRAACAGPSSGRPPGPVRGLGHCPCMQ
jgi:hypothetical protein